MTDQEQKEIQKRELQEQMTPISQDLVKLAGTFNADIFLVVNAPHLGLYSGLSQIQRLTTIDRCVAELDALRANTSLWLDVGLTIEDEPKK